MSLPVGFLGHVSVGGGEIDPSIAARLRASVDRHCSWSGRQACLVGIDAESVRPHAARPWVSPSGCVTVLSGYLFDPEALARSLSLGPGLADAAIAAAWLERHEPDRLAELPGDFALAQWCPHDARLLLAVAPMAGRLIYWHLGVGTFSCATTVAALHRIPSVPREIDPLQFTTRFTARIGDASRTIYRDVRLLSPGEMLVADGHGCRKTVLWEPDLARRIHLGSDAAYAEAARELLDRAVANRMRTARSPGFLASGGLDSAAILTSAARQSEHRPIHSYTAIPPSGVALTPGSRRYLSEQPKLAALAAQYPNLHPSFCSGSTPAAMETHPAGLFMHKALPCMMASHLAWFDPAHRAIQRAGHDVVLVGDMGNFTLSFDGLACFSDLVREGRLLTAVRLMRRVAAYSGRQTRSILRNSILVPLLPRRLAERHRQRRLGRHPLARHAAIRSAWLDDVGISAYTEAHGESSVVGAFSDSRQLIAHFVTKRRTERIQNHLLLESVYGFQHRDVFADRDLLEFCLAIPREQFIIDGRDRSLIRRVLEGQAPRCIVNETCHGHQNPEWVSRLLQQRETFAAEIESFSQHPMLAEMLDIPRLRTLLDQMPRTAEEGEGRQLEYTTAFTRAIQMGRFVRWSTGANQ